jgi:hypothetical protein
VADLVCGVRELVDVLVESSKILGGLARDGIPGVDGVRPDLGEPLTACVSELEDTLVVNLGGALAPRPRTVGALGRPSPDVHRAESVCRVPSARRRSP